MEYCVLEPRKDGLGSQLQSFIYAILISECSNRMYLHIPIKEMEHNYEGDPQYLEKIEDLMNIKNTYLCMRDQDDYREYTNITQLSIGNVIRKFEENIDFYLKSESFQRFKTNFWKNKDRAFWKNGKTNVAVHVRRVNPHDGKNAREYHSFQYFFNIMERIRLKYKDRDLLFHIYSQGSKDEYIPYHKEDMVYHIDEDLAPTFIGMVSADILLTSSSSISYVAGLLSDGEIYYQPFWHPPPSHWIVC